MRNILKSSLAILLSASTQYSIYSQANPNPCGTPGVKCMNGGGNGIINSFGSKDIIYTCPGRSMPFWFAYGDTVTNTIDTSSNAAFAISSVFGPGGMNGHNGTLPAKFCYLNDIEFTEVGIYQVGITMTRGNIYTQHLNFEVVPEKYICAKANYKQCGAVKGNKILANAHCGNVITVDAVFPINVSVVDTVSGKIDTNYSGTIYAKKIAGPGVIYGTLSMSGKRWFDFTNIHFSENGNYTIQFAEQDSNIFKNATVEVIVTSTTKANDIKKSGVSLFPNPFNEQINVIIEDVKGQLSYIIYDYTGKIVLQKSIENTSGRFTIDTKNLNSGFYILNINDAQNKELKNSFIIKQ